MESLRMVAAPKDWFLKHGLINSMKWLSRPITLETQFSASLQAGWHGWLLGGKVYTYGKETDGDGTPCRGWGPFRCWRPWTQGWRRGHTLQGVGAVQVLEASDLRQEGEGWSEPCPAAGCCRRDSEITMF